MAETTGRWKKIVARVVLVMLAVVLVGAMLAYKAYEPLIANRWGWKMPPDDLTFPLTSRHAPGWEAAAAKADEILKTIRARTYAPSVSAAVLVDGEVVWAGTIGYANLEHSVPATPQTAYRIGSSSKAVTSVAMGTLLDQGRIDLDAPLSRYVPDVGGVLARITTRQAMSHTAGIRDYGACLCFPVIEYFNRRHYTSQRDTLRPIEHSKLLFEPGTGYSYTSLGYNLSGAVIESVTGQRFADFLAARVFKPLGMSASRADTGIPVEGEAVFYDVSLKGYKPVFPVDNTNKLPSGGILASPSDLVQIGQQMIRPTLFGTATRDLLATLTRLNDGSVLRQGYALGWRRNETTVRSGTKTTPMLHHHGTALGAVSHFEVYPEEGIAISLMMNVTQARFGPEAVDALVDLFLAERDKLQALPEKRAH
jgi:serine beta-lactamase-like protein LACTB, mitochondrial